MKTWIAIGIAAASCIALLTFRARSKPSPIACELPKSYGNNESYRTNQQGEIFPHLREPQSLFNSRDLTGWRHIGGGRSFVKDGLLMLANDADRKPGYLVSQLTAKNFRASIRCQVPTGDSGFYFRAGFDPHTPTEVLGPQVQLNTQPNCGLGGIFETQGRGWLTKPSAEFNARLVQGLDWFDCDVEVIDRHIRVTINGTPTVDFTDSDPDNRYQEAGFFALQIHGGGYCDARFQTIRVQPLD